MTGPDDTDRELSALLVFLANGTLEGEEKARVEAAVAADPALQVELASLRAIRARMQDEALPQSPGAFGQARLMRDLDREARPLRSNRLWQGVAAAAMALLVVQTLVVQTGSDLRLAEGKVEVASGPVLTVAFAGTATEAEIRALLIELDLTIVSGPSALGLYRLAARDEAARAAALERFGAATGLVESAEAEE
jgi:anti-sigma factor RsiW